jgi:hypothetical protein
MTATSRTETVLHSALTAIVIGLSGTFLLFAACKEKRRPTAAKKKPGTQGKTTAEQDKDPKTEPTADTKRAVSATQAADARSHPPRDGGAIETSGARGSRLPARTVPTGAFDIMTAAVIPVGRNLSKAARKARRITYTLTFQSAKVTVPQTDFQKVKRTSPHKLQVTVLRPDRTALPRMKVPMRKPKPALKPFLRPTATLQSNAPLIRSLARKAVRGARRAAVVATRLEKFVHGWIKRKGYGVGAATALDTAKLRRGDCSEHAYLMAAMARAVGLPSRVASGALFAHRFQQRKNVFVYHMWTELRIGGQWVGYDATRPEVSVGATHLVLATDDMNALLPVQSSMALMRALGQLNIKIDAIHP